MRSLMRKALVRILGSLGATIIGVGTLAEIVRHLTPGQSPGGLDGPRHKQIAALRQQLAAALSLGPGSAPASTHGSGTSEVSSKSARDMALDADIFGLPRRLDRAGAAYLKRADAAPQAADELRGLAAFCAAMATLVSQYGISRQQRTATFPDDDGTLEHVLRQGIWVPGGDVELESGRQLVPWRHLFDDPETGVFLVMGQSNAANHGSGFYGARENVYSFDFLRLQAYRAEDPLPGASGNGGSVWTRLGDRLIAEGLYRQVLFVPVAFGGTFAADWAPGGAMHGRTRLALSRLRNALGTHLLNFSAVLWQQGEAEANHTEMPATQYQGLIHEIAADLRENGVFAPIFVALSTLCEAGDHPHRNHAAIRSAQMGLANAANGFLRGPDTDTIDVTDRFDGCHLSEAGLQRCADLWFQTIAAKHELLMKI